MKLLRWAAACIVAVLVLAAGYFWYAVYGDRSYPQAPQRIVIERGSTLEAVARQLAGASVIGNVLTFRALAKFRGQETSVRAGEYRIAPHVTQSEVLRALVTGGAQIAAWVTIPEGFTAAQIAGRLQAQGLGSAAAFRHEFMAESLSVDGARTKSLEGFLFPSTYLVPFGDDPSAVAVLLTNEFFKQLPAGAASRARALRINIPQAVTIASLVEREAKNEADRPHIAAVIYARLRLGMPLQIDATIEYALPEHKDALSFADLRIDSPYNTYVHPGLPPTPIANPGLPSLEAALNPSKSEDLYYVYCGNGRHVFAKTLSEHQANVARCLQ
jgi:UPF0755 protein